MTVQQVRDENKDGYVVDQFIPVYTQDKIYEEEDGFVRSLILR